MANTYTGARGERGDVLDTRSITAQKYLEGRSGKAALDAAITRTKNAFVDGDVKSWTSPVSGRAYAVPKEVYDYLTGGES